MPSKKEADDKCVKCGRKANILTGDRGIDKGCRQCNLYWHLCVDGTRNAKGLSKNCHACNQSDEEESEEEESEDEESEESEEESEEQTQEAGKKCPKCKGQFTMSTNDHNLNRGCDKCSIVWHYCVTGNRREIGWKYRCIRCNPNIKEIESSCSMRNKAATQTKFDETGLLKVINQLDQILCIKK